MSGDKQSHQIDALLAAVGRGADDDLARASARSRRQRRWLSQQAAESTTLAGVLLTRSEREDAVTVTTTAAALKGRINLVTRRLCAVELEGSPGAVALIPTAAITAIEGRGDVADDRLPAADTDLGTVLANLAADRPSIIVHLKDGTEMSGALLHVGHDVMALGRPPSVLHVRLDAVAACVL